jgi:hypothetical protein
MLTAMAGSKMELLEMGHHFVSRRYLRNFEEEDRIILALNLTALTGEDSQATLRITTLRLAPEGSHRPHASGF